MAVSDRTAAFEGHVDRVADGWVVGWAWRQDRPSEPVSVEVLVDGVPVVRAAAAIYRPDLERAGKGNGIHAFEIPLPEAVADGKERQVRVVFEGTTADLYGSPKTVRLGAGGGAGSEGSEPRAAAGGGTADRGPGYHSLFGGLWTDLNNARDILAGKLALGWITAAEARLLEAWLVDGFVVLEQAVPHEVIDELEEETARIWEGTSPARAFVEFWENDQMTIQPAGPRFRDRRVKLLDLFARFESARRIVFAEPIVRFLTLVFERPALAFQSLYFRWGSTQDIHQDTAFVKVNSPLEFAASWVALEDIRPGSGELEYYVGSHRLEDYLFDGERKWMPFRSTEYDSFIASLRTRSEARGLVRQRFLPKKGDVLIWAADLAHGGSKDATEGLTRKSLVTHYCPSSCEPVYGNAGSHPRHRFNDDASYTYPVRD